jgi:ABC-type cobalamin/Fe3+-siderophores transport system ATPase subunit
MAIASKVALNAFPCFELGPLDITFPKGKLTLVSGATGSGKSALLAALLGGQSPMFFQLHLLSSEISEMHCTSGEVFINKLHHKVAYCGQTPCMCFSCPEGATYNSCYI